MSLDSIENISGKYYDELLQSTNPGVTLTKFYCSLFEKDFSSNTQLIGRLGSMTKLFGRALVFYSILDTYGMETVDLSNIQRLIYYFCKKRFIESTSGEVTLIDLSDLLEQRKKKLQNTKTLKAGNPFDE